MYPRGFSLSLMGRGFRKVMGKMKMMTRQIIAGMVAGAVLLSGGLTYVHAGQDAGNRQGMMGHAQRGHHQLPHIDKEKAAQSIAEAFQLNKDEVLEALNANADFRDVGHASMLAKVSGKSFRDVFAMKTKDNHWKDVSDSLGITREQMRSAMNSLTAARIAERGNVEKSLAETLLKEGYHVPDIMAAGILAKASGKDIRQVLDQKKINNRWQDVAKSLGVDAKLLRDGMPGAGGFGGMMGGAGGMTGAPGGMPEEDGFPGMMDEQ